MGDEFSLSELMRALRARKRMVVAVVVGCMVAAGVITIIMPKIYRAQASVFFPAARESTTSAAVGALGQNPGMLGVLGRLGQATDEANLCKGIAESFSVQASICRQFKLQRRFHLEKFQDATDKLASATSVNVTPEGLLVILVDTKDPRLSADLANAYTRLVEARYRDSSVSRAREERRFLDGRLREAQTQLSDAEMALRRHQQRAKALLGPEEVPPILQKLADVRVDQAHAQVELEALQRKRADALDQLNLLATANGQNRSAGRSLYAVPWELSSTTNSDNPDVAQLRAELVTLEVRLASAQHNLTPEHPDVKQLQTQIGEIQRRLHKEALKRITVETKAPNPVYAAGLQDYVTLVTGVMAQEARAQGLASLVQDLEGQAAALPERLRQYSRLEREVHAREAVYETLNAQLEAAKLKELQDQPVFEILDRAVPPDRPDHPKMSVNLAVALIFGLFIAAAIAAALGPPTPRPAR